MSVCEICERKYDYKDKSKGHRINICNSCLMYQRRYLLKEKMVKDMGGKCKMCGYKKRLTSLDFHHKDKDKEFNFVNAYRHSWKEIEKELKKCILVCSNCHREIHDKSEDYLNVKRIEHAKNHMEQRASWLHFDVQKKCKFCSKEFDVKTRTDSVRRKYCSKKCYDNDSKKCKWPSPSQLREDISKMPYVRIGKKYGVSDNAVRKWARKYKIV